MIKLKVFIVIMLGIACTARAQDNQLLHGDSLNRYILNAMDKWKIPGAAVYIVKDGEIVLQKAYGYSSLNTRSKVNEQTVFPIASVTKTFTGTLFATLEAEGKIGLNDPVKKWLPQFTMRDKLYEHQITIADILTHRSGWKTFQGDLLNTESSLDFRTMIDKFGWQQPPYPLRTKFGYSNFGFIIAGECVESITRQSWNTNIRERFLSPLGMTRTLVTEEEIKNESNMAAGHTVLNDSLMVLPPDKIEPYSHGGIYASIGDLGTWVEVLLGKGMYNGRQVIPEKAIETMWHSYTIVGKQRAADRERYFKTYGLGWEIMQYHNREVISHGGAYSGALSSLTLIPDIGLGIVILTNQDNHLLQETLKWQVIDAFIQKEAPDYSLATIERHLKRKEENYMQVQVPAETEEFEIPLDSVVGIYECAAYGKAFITKKNNSYILTLEHHPQLEGQFSSYKKNQLICTYNHPMFGTVMFSFNFKNNSVCSFILYVDGFIETDGYEFHAAGTEAEADG